MTPNNQFQRSVNSRLRRLSPPAELERWTACLASEKNACSVAIVTTLVVRNGLPPFKVSGALNLAAANPSTFKASACGERTAGPHCTQAPSGRGTPVVSHTGVETSAAVPSAAATLAGFDTIECTDQTSLSRRANRALAGLGPQCLVVLGRQRWQSNPRYATRATRSQLGRDVHLVRVCGHAMRARSASRVSCARVQTSGLSQRRPGGGKEARVRQLAVVVVRSWLTPAASRLWVASRAPPLGLARARSA